MRQITRAAAAVLMATTFACSPRDRRETASSVDSVAADIRDETREGAAEVREEAREVRNYTFAERNDFRRDLDLQLKKLDINRLNGATDRTWEETKRSVNESLSALDREVRKLLPDAKPMGGTGPS